MFRRLLRIDWEVVAGIIAAIIAMILSFMGVISDQIVRGIVLLLCALLLTRDLRSEAREHRMFDKLDLIKRHVVDVAGAVQPQEIQLIGPKKIRSAYTSFVTSLHGEVRWCNACCRMFRRQEVFDSTLRPLLDNPNVTSVVLLCRPEDHAHWTAELLPKLRRCANGGKLHEPNWITIDGLVSVLIGDIDGEGRNEALVSILEEPFAAVSMGTSVPRYLIRVSNASGLMGHLEELARNASTGAKATDGSVVPHDAASR